MDLFEQINKDLIKALKEKEQMTLETLRMVMASLQNKKIALKKVEDLSDKDCLKILQQEAKKRKDSILAFEKGGRPELVEKEKQELRIIQRYLPQQLSEEELTKKIQEVVSNNSGLDFGPMMGKVMTKVKGQADGKLVQKILRQEISS